MKRILIYNDEGAHPFCVSSLLSALKYEKLDLKYYIKLVNKNFFFDAGWQANTHLIIMPGGRDVPYHNALTGYGNAQISEFVSLGGNFLGICAGGYYGSASIEFEKEGPLEIIGDRELKFFPGTAIGPAYGSGKFCYNSEKGAQIAKLNLFPPLSADGSSFAYYNGGCFFAKAERFANVSILARYADIEEEPAAIIRCDVGKGVAILSGVHPEYSVSYSDKDRFQSDLFLALQRIEGQRRDLFRMILELLI